MPANDGPSTAMPATTLPGFTIVVPTRARPRRLETCLESLARLDYDRSRVQVVIVDDGSPESPRPIIERFQNRMDIELLTRNGAGPAAARNAGAARARHECLAFTDDDCQPEPGWLRAFGRGMAATPLAMLGGSTVNALPTNVFSEASQELISYLYEYYNRPGGEARFLTSNNMAVPLDMFREVGGFSASFPLAAAEDRDFCDRWLAARHDMRYLPQARVRHSHNLNLRGFWRQHFGYGRGAHGYHRRRSGRGAGRIRPEPLRFYTGLLTYPLQQGSRGRAPALAALLAISQVANALGYFFEGWQRRRLPAPPSPPAG